MAVRCQNILIFIWAALCCHRATLGHPLRLTDQSPFKAGRSCEVKLIKRSVYSESKPMFSGLQTDDKYVGDPLIYAIPAYFEDEPIWIESSSMDQRPAEQVFTPDDHMSALAPEPKLSSRPSHPLPHGQTQPTANLVSRPSPQMVANAKSLQANSERPSILSQPVSAYLNRHPSNGERAGSPSPTNAGAQPPSLRRLAVEDLLDPESTSPVSAKEQKTSDNSKAAQKVISLRNFRQHAGSKPFGSKHVENARILSSNVLKPGIAPTESLRVAKVASKNLYSQPLKYNTWGEKNHEAQLFEALRASSKNHLRQTTVPKKFPKDTLDLKGIPDKKVPVDVASEAAKADLTKMLEDPTPYENVAAMERQRLGKVKESEEVDDKAAAALVQIMTGIQMVGEAEDKE